MGWGIARTEVCEVLFGGDEVRYGDWGWKERVSGRVTGKGWSATYL